MKSVRQPACRITRRDALLQGVTVAALAAVKPCGNVLAGESAVESAPIVLGSRRELFVDEFPHGA